MIFRAKISLQTDIDALESTIMSLVDNPTYSTLRFQRYYNGVIQDCVLPTPTSAVNVYQQTKYHHKEYRNILFGIPVKDMLYYLKYNAIYFLFTIEEERTALLLRYPDIFEIA